MRKYVRVETKEVELLGIRVEVEEKIDQREGRYEEERLLCNNCSTDLTELLTRQDIRYCPICGQDLIRRMLPAYTRTIL